MQFQGRIHFIGQTEVKSEKFCKRTVVILDDTNPQYPEYVPFEFTQKACEMLDGYQAGQTVIIDYDLRGREWQDPSSGETKFFGTIKGWRITPAGHVAALPPPVAAPYPVAQPPAPALPPNQTWPAQPTDAGKIPF